MNLRPSTGGLVLSLILISGCHFVPSQAEKPKGPVTVSLSGGREQPLTPVTYQFPAGRLAWAPTSDQGGVLLYDVEFRLAEHPDLDRAIDPDAFDRRIREHRLPGTAHMQLHNFALDREKVQEEFEHEKSRIGLTEFGEMGGLRRFSAQQCFQTPLDDEAKRRLATKEPNDPSPPNCYLMLGHSFMSNLDDPESLKPDGLVYARCAVASCRVNFAHHGYRVEMDVSQKALRQALAVARAAQSDLDRFVVNDDRRVASNTSSGVSQ